MAEDAQSGSTPRSPWVAGGLALLFPGLGHAYLGAWTEAGLWLLAPVLSVGLLFLWAGASLPGFWLCMGLSLAFQVIGPVRAILQARRLPDRPSRGLTHGALLLAVGLGLQFGLRSLLGWTIPHVRYRIMSLPSASMAPTVRPGARFVFDAAWYRTHALRPGDVVGFWSPQDPSHLYMKRCIALAGETVEIKGGVLFVNGKPADEPFLRHVQKDYQPGPDQQLLNQSYGPEPVPEGTFFCLGDDRGNSLDSRQFGPVPMANLEGKVLYLWWGGGEAGHGRSLDRARVLLP